MSAYLELESRFHRIAALGEAAGVLHWDMSVLMPPGGVDARTEQLTSLKLTIHEMKTAPELADLLKAAEDETSEGEWQKANLAEMRRCWVHANAVDPDLVEAMTRAGSACEMVWREARPENDYDRVLPYLEEVLNLSRQAASAKASALGCSDYEALLDQYEAGGRTDQIDALFADLERFLPDFIENAVAGQVARGDAIMPAGPFHIDRQRDLARKLMRVLGFDFDAGRLDISLHPFCGGVPGDIRVTTRYTEDDFMQSLMGVLHETGHALYEMGLPKDWRYQPVGSARGMALHESQSLLIEMQACRSREYMVFAAPLIREAFGGKGAAWEVENLYRLYTHVERSFIRVDADEVTYPAHVILRYRLERALIGGDLALKDLPGAWNDEMESLLGIHPPDDRQGCMQDIHWYDGAWGYFPTYTMGAMAAAQLFAAAKVAEPDITERISHGDVAPLVGWMRENLHAKASSTSTDDLMRAATGKPLGAEDFKAHLQARYG
ncbi:MAG: carboxypeptidase M32 [Pseudomonadota bacterium]|nr:carboxypeptidase M32 [Pseudomonadota bacterium]